MTTAAALMERLGPVRARGAGITLAESALARRTGSPWVGLGAILQVILIQCVSITFMAGRLGRLSMDFHGGVRYRGKCRKQFSLQICTKEADLNTI